MRRNKGPGSWAGSRPQQVLETPRRRGAGLERAAANHFRPRAPGRGLSEQLRRPGWVRASRGSGLSGPDMATVRASPRVTLLLLLAVAGVAEVAGGLAPGSVGE